MKPILCCSLVALSLVACHRDRTERERAPEREQATLELERLGKETVRDANDLDRAGTVFLTSASWAPNELAIDRITRARCAREIACETVGPGRRFANSDACVQEARLAVTSDLKVSECPAGIDGAELDTCLSAIRDESCGRSIAARSKTAACGASQLCLKVQMPHR